MKQSLIAYGRKALLESIAISRVVPKHWRGSVGILAEREEITQESVGRRSCWGHDAGLIPLTFASICRAVAHCSSEITTCPRKLSRKFSSLIVMMGQ